MIVEQHGKDGHEWQVVDDEACNDAANLLVKEDTKKRKKK
jgi:hypothetical protein